MSFPCPQCQGHTKVYDSRPVTSATIIWRRRRCSCGHKFSTYEIPMQHYADLTNALGRHDVEQRILQIVRDALDAAFEPTPAKIDGLRPRQRDAP